MNPPESFPDRQRIAFYIAILNFLGLGAWTWMRIYYVVVADPKADREFVFGSLLFLPFWALSWVIALIIVVNSISKSKRVSWHGAAALGMLAVPGIPIATKVVIAFWEFLSSS